MMSSWQIHEYGGVDRLKLAHDVEVPVVKKPDDVLVEVYAASVSPIDVKNMGQSLCFSIRMSIAGGAICERKCKLNWD